MGSIGEIDVGVQLGGGTNKNGLLACPIRGDIWTRVVVEAGGDGKITGKWGNDTLGKGRHGKPLEFSGDVGQKTVRCEREWRMPE